MTPAPDVGERPGTGTRRSGVLLPLFSFPSSASWGIGEIPDIAPMAAWLSAAGQQILQLLPINEMACGEQSPYSALSAMATDPIFIAVPRVPDFAALGGEAALDAHDRALLSGVRARGHVDHGVVRGLKTRALDRAFDRFRDHEWSRVSARARDLRDFVDREAWWLADYALYRALKDVHDQRPWSQWPTGLQARDGAALESVRATHADRILYYQYLQWIADDQWRVARRHARARGIALFGDIPFMVDGDSADVWARQDDFKLDASVGVPPDAFSATGQDWGMPAYRWSTVAAGGFTWLAARARRGAALFDGYRVDHLVGFYRTYSRPKQGGAASFDPPDERSQVALGERVLSVFRATGAEIIAEDLGVIPDFVRASLARVAAPGFKVFRWERQWDVEKQPFDDPATYPTVSVVTSGTHDTETLSVWWAAATPEEREAVAAIPSLRALAQGIHVPGARYVPTVRDLLLETLYAASSMILLLPLQDVFGWDDRINVPATVAPTNWTYRLPWPIDTIDRQPLARERQARLRGWSRRWDRTGRGVPQP